MADKKITSERARRAVDELLDLVDTPEKLPDQLGPILNELEKVPQDGIAALSNRLGEEDPRRRVMAAWLLLKLESLRANIVSDRRVLAVATRVIVEALRHRDEKTRCWPCMLLSTGDVPRSILSVLRRLLKDDSERIQVYAAAALSTHDAGGEGIIPALDKGLKHDDDALVVTAATAFARLGVRSHEAVSKLIAAFDRFPPAVQYTVLIMLEQIGEEAKEAAPPLAAFIADRKNAPFLRGTAAGALASIAGALPATSATLMKCLRSRDPEVIEGAMEGLERIGNFPTGTVEILVDLLSADNERLRLAAVAGIKCMGPDGASALSALLDRVGRESSTAMMESLAHALAAIGEPGIGPMIEIIKRHDMQKVPTISWALAMMGNKGAAELIEPLMRETDDVPRRIMVLILRDMGSRAAPAAPVLDKLLAESSDDDLTRDLIMALFTIGSAAAVATKSLIRRLSDANDEIAELAMRTLRQLGSAAVPELRLALDSATGAARLRIEELLASVQFAEARRFLRFEKLNDDALLRMFVYVAHILDQRGATSWREVATLINNGSVDLPESQIDFSTSASSIRVGMKRLEEELGFKLNDRVDGRKGRITPEALGVRNEVKRYLEFKRRRHGDLS